MSDLNQIILALTDCGLEIKIESQSERSLVISFKVRARPGARLSKISVSDRGELLVWVRAKPQDGLANEAIIASISSGLGVSKGAVQLEKGARGKEKRFTVCFEKKDNKPTSYYLEKLKTLVESA